MGAASSINDQSVGVALKGIKDSAVPGLDIEALRPYLEKFLRMRKVGMPVRACYQAAWAKLIQDGIDPETLKPLEEFLEIHVGENNESKWTSDEDFYEGFYRSGPEAEDLLSVFGFSEQELKHSMQNTKTNNWDTAYGGFDTPAEYHNFMERYLPLKMAEALIQARDDGATDAQVESLRMRLNSQAKYEELENRVKENAKNAQLSRVPELISEHKYPGKV